MDRFAFQIGSFTVTWYGLCVAAGFWLGSWTAARRAPRAGVHGDSVWDLLWVLILGGIVGARALYVVTYWDRDFRNQPLSEIFMVHHGGLVFHGGFLVAVLAGFAWCRWKGIPGWRMADIMAPSLALGHALGRMGCLINGCCYGRRCDLPWAIRYPSKYGFPEAALHPTQVYEALLGLGLAWLLGRRFASRRFDGEVFAGYLIGYALLRSVVECFRGDYPASALAFGRITPAHWVSLVLLAMGILVYLVRCRSGRPCLDARAAGAAVPGPDSEEVPE